MNLIESIFKPIRMAKDCLFLVMSQDISSEERKRLQKEINAILDNEIELARELFKVSRRDSRIGFEATNSITMYRRT